MAKQHLLVLGLMLSGSALFAACSSDVTTGSSGGAAGSNAEAGAPGSGAEGGEAGAPVEFTGSLNPQGVIVPAVAPATSAHFLAAGTDFMKTEIASVTLATGKIDDDTVFMDGDAIAVSSAGIGFALERTNDKAYVLDGSMVKTTFDLKDKGTATAALPLSNKAFVPFLGQSLIAILDLAKGVVSRRIDLTEYNVAGDTDGSADIADAVYDPNKKIVYFVLQRIDRNTVAAAPYQLACPTAAGLIVGIDAATDKIVDLNGDADGDAIELKLVSQNSLSVNADGTSLYMLASGCYVDGTLKNQGVEVVDLTDGTSQVAYAPEGSDYLARLILTGGSDALLGSFDSAFATHWNKLDIAAGKLQGAELKNVPQAVTFDGTDLLGVSIDSDMVGTAVRYTIATDKAVPISDSLWASKYMAAATTALVK